MFHRSLRSRAVKRVALMATATATFFTFEESHLKNHWLRNEQEDGDEDEKDEEKSHLRLLPQWYRLQNKAMAYCESASVSAAASAGGSSAASTGSVRPSFFARRMQTMRRMKEAETKDKSLESIYQLDKKTPLGEGAFGQVFLGIHRTTGEKVAVKKIWKEFTDREDCQREMNALLHIRAHGGHPHICSLRENFDEKEHYALVLDLINGGELFDRLVENGAYSELDASRLMREVASAMNFLHGIGVVHGDLKPENLMLSQTHTSAIIKVVDFGCSELTNDANVLPSSSSPLPLNNKEHRNSSGTVAYSSPEQHQNVHNQNLQMAPSKALDMWALGIILYIMLTGMHPLDPEGMASDEELKERLQTIYKKKINILKSAGPVKSFARQHLSPSAIQLLSRLLEPDPKKRITASELVENSWIRGITATSQKIEDSDKRLSKFRKYRSKIETKVFQELMALAELQKTTNSDGSLFQKAFSSMDKEDKGFLTVNDVAGGGAVEAAQLMSRGTATGTTAISDTPNTSDMSLSEFSDLLGENMVSRYFPSGHVLYREGDIGNHMYFINSGKIEVTTKDGFRATLKHGDTFGEGGLLNENRQRSATLKTLTPVHVIQIDRECFTKYLKSSDSVLAMQLREKVNARKKGRAEYILSKHKDLAEERVPKGHVIYSKGDRADRIYTLTDGIVDVVNSKGQRVYDVKPGELFGVQSFLMEQQGRRAFAKCVSPHGCIIKSLPAQTVAQVLTSNPGIRESLMDLALRREFQRAIVRKMGRSFPLDRKGLRMAFDAIDLDQTGKLNIDEVRDLLVNHLADAKVSEGEIEALLATLDLQKNGIVDFDEFCSIFGR